MLSSPQPQPPDNKRLNWLWVLSLFFLGVGVKFLKIVRSDSPLPYLDQWDAEAINTYLPFFHHTLSLADLFRAHNEHRIVMTKVYDLLLLIFNHQWDSELQMTISAIIHSAIIAGFGWLMASLLGWKRWPFIWVILLLALVPPFSWENTLGGFQSQFYFMILFALLTIWLLGGHEPWTKRWYLGVAMGVVGLFTMATGFMAATAVAMFSLIDIIKDKSAWRRQMPTLIICLAITIAGLLLTVEVPRHRIIHALSLFAFEKSLGKNLAWPACFLGWSAPLNLLPLILLAWAYGHQRTVLPKPLAARITLIIGAWAIAQGIASAYARGGETGNPPASRYMDVLSFIMIANFFSVLLLWEHYRRGWGKRIAALVFATWGLFCLAGLVQLTYQSWVYKIPSWMEQQYVRTGLTRAFLRTDNIDVFDKQRLGEINLPHTDVDELAALLRDPDVRGILPDDVRPPMIIPRDGFHDGVFVTNGYSGATFLSGSDPVWGSFGKQGSKAKGPFESLAMNPGSLPYLQFWINGDLGQRGTSLELHGLRTGKITKIKSGKGNNWRKVYVKNPAEPFKLVAHDDSETGWFAFEAPIELGSWSYWSRLLLKRWLIFEAIGMGCGMCAVIDHLRLRSRELSATAKIFFPFKIFGLG